MASRSDTDATIRNALQRCDATCRTARAKKDDTLAAIDAPLGSQRWIAELNAAWDDFRTTIREAGIQYSAIRADALIETETAPATPTTPGILEFHRASRHSVFVASASEYNTTSESLFDIQLAIFQLSDGVFRPPAENRRSTLIKKLDVVGKLISKDKTQEAVDKLRDDILVKVDGFSGGDPGDDWIKDQQAQLLIYQTIQDLISLLTGMPKPDEDQFDTQGTVLPETFDVSNAYPNPFNPLTEINYQLPEASRVTLNIYNALGQKIRTLLNQTQQPGYHTAIWDSKNDRGDKVSTGLYICRIHLGERMYTRKLILME